MVKLLYIMPVVRVTQTLRQLYLKEEQMLK